MGPKEFKMAMDYLTRAKRVKPDLPDVFRASEAPIPPIREDVKLREAINRFVRDNPRQDMAGGGMLVQPGFGGTRQGYAKEKNVREGPTAQAIKEIINKQTVFKNRQELRDKIKSKIGRDPGVMRPARYPDLKKAKYKDEMNLAEAKKAEQERLEKGRKERATRREQGLTTRQIRAKKKAENEILRRQREAEKVKAAEALFPENIAKLDRPLKKGEIIILNKSYQNIFKEEYARLLNEGELFSKTDLARAVINRVAEENPTIDLQKGIGLDKIPGGGNEESKTIFDNINKIFNEKQKRNFTTNTNALAYTKNQDRLLQALLAGNNDFDDLMNELGMNEGRLKGNVNKLMKNLAQTDKSKQPLFFRKYNQKELEQARNSIYESPTLESAYQRTIVQSVLQSTKLGSPERKQALQKLKEFNQFKKALENNGISGKIISLDHAASYRAIKNGNLKDFLSVTPILSDINAVKSSFDRRSQLNLRRMQDAIEAGDNATYKKFLKNQTELEGIWKTMTGDQSSLGKIRVQPGGKAKGVTKIYDFGATSILDKDKNLINELADNLVIRRNIVNASTEANLNEVSRIMFEGSAAQKPRPSALPESFKKLNDPKMFSQEKKIAAVIQNYSKLDKCRIGSMDGGRIGFKFSDECLRDGLNEAKKAAASGDKKAARQLVKTAEVAARGRLLKNVLGPGAILGEAVYEGAVIGNKVLGGTPADIAYAESYLSYLDPRKYRGELDPTTMRREDMLESTADKNILRSGFAAQDQLSAFNQAIEDRDMAKSRGRIDQYIPAAAEAREQGRLADQSADIISSEAFKDASQVAQEYLQGQAGKQQAGFGAAAVPQSVMADETRRLQAMREMKNLYPQYSDEEILDILKQSNLDPKDYDYTFTPKTVEDKPLFPAAMGVKPLTGFDAVRDYFRQLDQTQAIADAGGVANLAGGGIAKLAGVDSGPPPPSGPNSQGLQGLMKRVKRI